MAEEAEVLIRQWPICNNISNLLKRKVFIGTKIHLYQKIVYLDYRIKFNIYFKALKNEVMHIIEIMLL